MSRSSPATKSRPISQRPRILNELLANETRQSAPPRSVVVQFRVPSEGVAFHGHVAPRLPPFALDALRPAHSDVGPEPFYCYVRTVVPLEQYVEGRDHVHSRCGRSSLSEGGTRRARLDIRRNVRPYYAKWQRRRPSAT